MKRFLAAVLAVIMALSIVPVFELYEAVPTVSAASYALTQVRKEIYNRNYAFRSYADKNIFDLEYFRTPTESSEKRAEYEKVVRDLEAMSSTDADLVRNIYLVVTSYIYYDYDYYYNSSKGTYFDASDVFKYRRTVCEGYANLFIEMCRVAGIPARKPEGLGLSNLYTEDQQVQLYTNNIINHSWCEYYIDGKWHFCDPTWDSGNTYSDGEFHDQIWNWRFFDLSVSEYSDTHLTRHYETLFSVDGLLYLVTETTDVMSGYIGDGDLTIPMSERVKTVDEYAFFEELKLRNVVIGEGITAIEKSAFCGAENLKTIRIPVSVTSIGDYAFGYSGYGSIISHTCSLDTVYYEGTRAQWNKISIGNYNYGIDDAELICLGDGEEPTTKPTTTEPTTEPTTKPTTTEPTTTEPTTTGPTTIEPTTTEPTTTEPTTEEPTTKEPIPEDECTCYCHASGFGKIIYRLLRFFWKIMNIRQNCDCGNIHY